MTERQYEPIDLGEHIGSILKELIDNPRYQIIYGELPETGPENLILYYREDTNNIGVEWFPPGAKDIISKLENDKKSPIAITNILIGGTRIRVFGMPDSQA